MIKIVLPLTIVCFLCSCATEDTPTISAKTSYYQFTDEDVLKLIPTNCYNPGDTITYVNEDSETLQFVVRLNEITKHSEAENTNSQDFVNFYYDEQFIEMYSTLFREDDYLGESSFFIRQKKWPSSFSGINAIPSDDSDFMVSMGLKPFSEKIPETGIDLSKKEYTLHAQNTNYTGVIRTTINETGASGQWPLPALKYVYFVEEKGIMGFDDLNGHTWRRK